MKTSFDRSIRIARTLLPALLVVAATGLAAVEEGEGRQPKRGVRANLADRDAERMARVLQLTEDQKEQWRRLRDEQQASVGPLMRQMRDITERLESEANIENPDPAVVGQLEIDRRAVARRLRTSRIQVAKDLKRLLDRDQTIRWEALRENGRGGFRGPVDPGGRGPRPRN